MHTREKNDGISFGLEWDVTHGGVSYRTNMCGESGGRSWEVGRPSVKRR